MPVGRLSADECEAIAALADKYSGGEIRLTVEQNILLPNVERNPVRVCLLCRSFLFPFFDSCDNFMCEKSPL